MGLKDAEATLRRAVRPNDLCPVTEAAARARISPYTVWRLIKRGQVRTYGRPGTLRVSVADLLPEYDPQEKL